MRAAILEAPGRLTIGTWDTPRPPAGEVLVKVDAAGICAGDISIYQGRNPYARYPQICGHEMAGVVDEVGSGVSGFSVGELVVVEPFIGCGVCTTCRIGKPNCCPRLTILGVNRAGGYAEYVSAPVRNVHRVPAGMPATIAAMAEPVAIAVQACRRGQVGTPDRVLVLGCGPIGLAIIEVARARGAEVVAADLLEDRLEAASRVGARVMRADDTLPAAVLAHTGGEGFPVIIEATGNPRAIEASLALVAAGGRVVIVGLVKDGLGVTFPGLDLTRKEPTILGSRASVDCFPEALGLLSDGKIQSAKLTRALSLWDAPAIFAELSKNSTSLQKALLVL